MRILTLLAVCVICGGACVNGVAAELTVVTTDDTGEPLSDAVVSFTVPGAKSAAPRDDAHMRQRDKDFVPKVLAVATGTSVRFPNDDPVLHHVYSFSAAKAFELELYSNDVEPRVEFDTAGVVVVGCNIHDEMRGYIYVTSHSHFGTTDNHGETRFERLQAGNYELRIWHPRQAASSEMQVTVALSDDAERRVHVALDLHVDHATHVDPYERGGYE